MLAYGSSFESELIIDQKKPYIHVKNKKNANCYFLHFSLKTKQQQTNKNNNAVSIISLWNLGGKYSIRMQRPLSP